MKEFEALSGIKINLFKTELFPFNTDSNFSQEATSLFGCKLGKFPFKYLGLPLHDRKLAVKDWNFLLNKLTNKL